MPTAEIKRHWDRVGSLRCLITGKPAPTLHHCRGGSMVPIIGLKSLSQKTSDWLVIPLDEIMHTGALGIDSGMGVKTWEEKFGQQVLLLDQLCWVLGYNVWERAGIDRPATMRRTV